MSLRKNNSRNGDRNRIRRMHRQGFDVEQISAATSITSEHINYILNDYEDDLKARKATAKELVEIKEAKEAPIPASKVPMGASDIQKLREQIKAELLEELTKPEPVAEVQPELDLDQVGIDDEELPEAPKRRKRKAA